MAWTVYSPKLARGMSVSRRLDRQAARKAKKERDGELTRVRGEASMNNLSEKPAMEREMSEVRVDFGPVEPREDHTRL